MKLVELYNEQRKSKDALYKHTQIIFAYNNFVLEGVNVTLEQVEAVFNNQPTDITPEEEVLVRNHFYLFDYMLDTFNEPLGEELLLNYHAVLVKDTEYNTGYRTCDTLLNKIAENPSYSSVVRRMRTIIRKYNDEKVYTLRLLIDYFVEAERVAMFENFSGTVNRMMLFRELMKQDSLPIIFYSKKHSPVYSRFIKNHGIREMSQPYKYIYLNRKLTRSDMRQAYDIDSLEIKWKSSQLSTV